ncbi:hypothetical protein [uncultured Agrobacterium sp.]|uniref:hypothetical protein n=1 Tax=uncultured Agrobacterium sp. TaxID=157277 RepID=UPI0025F29F76|nr:hypothetical protein [uncultured Agrobacterium sp.]
MKKLLIYLENFLPSSQAFIINQTEGFHRFDTERMAGKRINSAHTKNSSLRVSGHENMSQDRIRGLQSGTELNSLHFMGCLLENLDRRRA